MRQTGVGERGAVPDEDRPQGDAASLTAAANGRRRKATNLLLAALCVLGAVANLGSTVSAALDDLGGVDFNEFYAASRLAGSGHLYDRDALRKLEEGHLQPLTPSCGRLPVVSFAMKPLTLVGYTTARFLWMAILVLSLVGFAWMWPGVNRRLIMLALAWSVPAGYILVSGQDSSLWLVSFAAGLLLLERGRPRLAGVAFALCLSKYHLALGIPVFLVAQKRWQTLVAGGVTLAALLAACFPIEGLAWPLQYWKIVSYAPFSVDGRMTNLRGIAYWLPASSVIEAAGGVVLLVLLWRVCRGTAELGMVGAAAVACGLMWGHHGYGYDCLLLMPLAVLILEKPGPLWMRAWAALTLTPLVIYLLVTSQPWWGQMLVVGFVFAAMAVEARRASTARIHTCAAML